MISKEIIIESVKSRFYFINPKYIDRDGRIYNYKTLSNENSHMIQVREYDKDRYLVHLTNAVAYFGGEIKKVDKNLNIVDFGIFKIKIEINKLVYDLNTLSRHYYIDVY